MELRTDDVMSMVNEHHEEMRMEKERAARKEKREAKKQKKELTKRRVKAALIFTAGIAIGTIGNDVAKPYIEGKNEIIKEFDAATDGYGIRDYAGGFQIDNGKQLLDFDYGVNCLISAAKEKGMNDVEIAIGLNSHFSDKAVEEYINTSFKERYDECSRKYHTSQLLKIEEKSNEGTVKGNGK